MEKKIKKKKSKTEEQINEQINEQLMNKLSLALNDFQKSILNNDEDFPSSSSESDCD